MYSKASNDGLFFLFSGTSIIHITIFTFLVRMCEETVPPASPLPTDMEHFSQDRPAGICIMKNGYKIISPCFQNLNHVQALANWVTRILEIIHGLRSLAGDTIIHLV